VIGASLIGRFPHRAKVTSAPAPTRWPLSVSHNEPREQFSWEASARDKQQPGRDRNRPAADSTRSSRHTTPGSVRHEQQCLSVTASIQIGDSAPRGRMTLLALMSVRWPSASAGLAAVRLLGIPAAAMCGVIRRSGSSGRHHCRRDRPRLHSAHPRRRRMAAAALHSRRMSAPRSAHRLPPG